MCRDFKKNFFSSSPKLVAQPCRTFLPYVRKFFSKAFIALLIRRKIIFRGGEKKKNFAVTQTRPDLMNIIYIYIHILYIVSVCIPIGLVIARTFRFCGIIENRKKKKKLLIYANK